MIYFKLLSFLLLLHHGNSASIIRQENPNTSSKRILELDDNGKVLMSWEVDESTSVITFEVEAETLGYIGFGISPQGSMTGADIFIAGVNSDGSVYSSDRFGIGSTAPKVDDHSDWTLLEAREFSGINNLTYIKFSRLLNTCDEEDHPINGETTRIIWALGVTDEIVYHTSDRRGTRSVLLLGSAPPELDTEALSKWDFTIDMVMPHVDTAYWCTFHKGPLLTKKHHIIGLDVILPDAKALKHTHHLVLYNCYKPPNSDETEDEIFGNYTADKFPGNFCYDSYEDGRVPLPTHLCQEIIYVWAKGGHKMIMPENVGYAIGPESVTPVPGSQQYYMLEIHYDNPDVDEGVKFETGASILYTDKLKDIEAGMMVIQYDTNPTLTVPPNMDKYLIAGHCSPSCTENFPEENISIFSVMLHSHLSGRDIKLRHFRGDEELPWIDYDGHYDFNFQQYKSTNPPRVIENGDQITVECSYNTAWKNGSAVIGSLSTNDEMCQSFIWYYPKMDIGVCGSSIPIDDSVADFGISEYHLIPSPSKNVILMIDQPLSLAGEYEETLNLRFKNWTKAFTDELEVKRRYANQGVNCYKLKQGEQLGDGLMVKYPTNLNEYVPLDECANRQFPSSTTQKSSANSIKLITPVYVILLVLFAAYELLL